MPLLKKRWTDQELKIVSDCKKNGDQLHSLLPHRSKDAIMIKSRKMGWQRKGEALYRSSQNYRELLNNKQFCQVIDGELLGDGCIYVSTESLNSPFQYYIFTYTTINKEYITYLHRYLCKMTGSKVKISSYKNKKKHFLNGREVIGKPSFRFSVNHVVFKSFHNRWYKEGKKIVPDDFELTPIVCKHWYIGDGCLQSKRALTIILHTNCFKKNEVERLISRLSNQNIFARCIPYIDNQFLIKISKEYVVDFLNYIGPCPVSSYNYKWNLNNYKKYEKECVCGNRFHFWGFHDIRKYCSKKCFRREKSKRLEKRQIRKLSIPCDDIFSDHNNNSSYILGLLLASGKIIDDDIMSIEIKNNSLYSQIKNCLKIEKTGKYKSTLFLRSKKAVSWLKNARSLNFDFDKICPPQFHKNLLRAIFDTNGTIAKDNRDGYFLIAIVHKNKNLLQEIGDRFSLKINANNCKGLYTLRIGAKDRKRIFDLLYIQSEFCFKNDKKYQLFLSSVLGKNISESEK